MLLARQENEGRGGRTGGTGGGRALRCVHFLQDAKTPATNRRHPKHRHKQFRQPQKQYARHHVPTPSPSANSGHNIPREGTDAWSARPASAVTGSALAPHHQNTYPGPPSRPVELSKSFLPFDQLSPSTQECRAEWPTGEITTCGYFEMFIS